MAALQRALLALSLSQINDSANTGASKSGPWPLVDGRGDSTMGIRHVCAVRPLTAREHGRGRDVAAPCGTAARSFAPREFPGPPADRCPVSDRQSSLARVDGAPARWGSRAAGGTRESADLVGLLAVIGAGLLPVVFADDLYYRSWAPKAALCLVLLGPGLVVLARLVVDGSRGAMLAAGFLAAAALSTALADKPVLSLVGAANWGTGLLFVATLTAAWALGASAGERRRRQLVVAIIAAAVANAAVAWLQVRGLAPQAMTDLRPGIAGRAGGLTGNPVQLGALAAGALWLLGRRLGRERASWWWLAAVVLVAGAAHISGGRAPAALAVVAALASLPGAGVARGAALVVAIAAGAVAAPAGADDVVLGSARAAETAIARSDTRFAVWRISGGAVLDRPLVGWGPGRFEAATTPRYDVTIARSGTTFKDAHNWVVEYAVTTGLVGVALLLAWLASAAWTARGPLVGFAVIVGASSLVEPLHAALTPLALLALGGAGPTRSHGNGNGGPLGRRWGAVAVVALAAGVVTAALLLAGQVFLKQGQLRDSPRQVQRALALSPPWPEVAAVAASVEVPAGQAGDESHRRKTLELARRATRRDPADPAPWAELGLIELAWGSDSRAAVAFRRSLERNPWGVDALRGSVTLAGRQGDHAALAASCRRLRALDRAPPECPEPRP